MKETTVTMPFKVYLEKLAIAFKHGEEFAKKVQDDRMEQFQHYHKPKT